MIPTPATEHAFWIIRHHNEVRIDLRANDNAVFLASDQTPFAHLHKPLHIGQWRGAPCYAAECDTHDIDACGEWVMLRPLFGLAGIEAFALAGRAFQLLDWQKHHRFCGHCATPTEQSRDEFVMTCPSCGLLAYPRISPAVMVLIRKGREFLLARSPHFKEGVFSALAGFVEAGETLEECAVREVREEVGVEISNLRYFQSQPWPFPNSLMLAFFAEYAGGEIVPDPKEIEAAGWFSREALPTLPEPVSIARRLIDAACQEVDKGF